MYNIGASLCRRWENYHFLFILNEPPFKNPFITFMLLIIYHDVYTMICDFISWALSWAQLMTVHFKSTQL